MILLTLRTGKRSLRWGESLKVIPSSLGFLHTAHTLNSMSAQTSPLFSISKSFTAMRTAWMVRNNGTQTILELLHAPRQIWNCVALLSAEQRLGVVGEVITGYASSLFRLKASSKDCAFRYNCDNSNYTRESCINECLDFSSPILLVSQSSRNNQSRISLRETLRLHFPLALSCRVLLTMNGARMKRSEKQRNHRQRMTKLGIGMRSSEADFSSRKTIFHFSVFASFLSCSFCSSFYLRRSWENFSPMLRSKVHFLLASS